MGKEMRKLNLRNLFISLSIIAAFILGVLFNPMEKMEAKTNNAPATMKEDNAFICPISGETMGRGAGMHGYFLSGTMHERIAAELDMTSEELHSARLEGKSIAELAEEKGLAPQALIEKLLHARKSELEQFMHEGKITEAQMNTILERMETRIKTALERKTTGPMNTQRGRMGMGQGPRFGCPF